jgi:hypothetical protein
MDYYKGSDGTEYYAKPLSGAVTTAPKGKVQFWLDGDGQTIWEPIRIGTGKGRMMWTKKKGK